MEVCWLEHSERDPPEDEVWLSPSERERLHSLRFAPRRADWKLGRWTAKCALAGYLRLPGDRDSLASIEIRSKPTGAPEAYLANQPAPAAISLSHRAGFAVCAVAPPNVALGCDLELAEPRSEPFVADFFTTEEQHLIGQVPASHRLAVVALLWSAKESTLKALGVGLREDTRSVRIGLFLDVPGFELPGVWRPFEGRCHDRVFQGWWRQTGGMIWTVCAEPAPEPPVLLQACTRV